jgi:Trk-type K+ transport system membrane component
MKRRPIPVLIVALLFIVAGGVGFVYHAKEYSEKSSMNYEFAAVLLIRALAVVCGILLLKRIKWARWLALAWLAYHIVLSAFHSVSETITHSVLLVIVAALLFIPKSSAYFISN